MMEPDPAMILREMRPLMCMCHFIPKVGMTTVHVRDP